MYKTQAALLRVALADAGCNVSVSFSLELLAAAHAVRDWQALRASPRAALLTGGSLTRSLDARLRRAGHEVASASLVGVGARLRPGLPLDRPGVQGEPGAVTARLVSLDARLNTPARNTAGKSRGVFRLRTPEEIAAMTTLEGPPPVILSGWRSRPGSARGQQRNLEELPAAPESAAFLYGPFNGRSGLLLDPSRTGGAQQSEREDAGLFGTGVPKPLSRVTGHFRNVPSFVIDASDVTGLSERRGPARLPGASGAQGTQGVNLTPQRVRQTMPLDDALPGPVYVVTGAFEWVFVTGRGQHCYFRCLAPGVAVGELIEVEGALYRVRAIESHPLPGLKEQRYVGQPIGVFVPH